MSQPRNTDQVKTGTQVVHVTDSNLDALFDAVMHPKDGQVPLQVPMKLRNLPQSFFKPPETGSKSVSHSRESSADSSTLLAGSVGSPSAVGQQSNTNHLQTNNNSGNSGVQIHHPRAHSSPASLQQTYNANTSQHQHLRQQSYDIIDNDLDSTPLPSGWEMAKTASGQKYFLNHVTQTTQWEDPRKKITVGNIQINASNNNNPPLPPLQASGSVPNIVTVSQAGQSQGPNAGAGIAINPQNLGTLPDGWEQAVTPEGEVYFINHQERSTSWFDPRIPAHLQRPSVSNQGVEPNFPGGSSGMSLLQQRQQKLRLQRLQIERERLRLRQQEILRQAHPQNLLNSQQQSQSCSDLMLRRGINDDLNNASSPPSNATPSSTGQTVTGMDPFLGQVNSSTANTTNSDYHSRQESADSGLGMGPGSYSLPPEDYLSNMDEGMDSTNTDENQSQTPNPDLSTLSLGGPEDNNMDSDDLVPSLQEELSTDILKDVEALLNTNKMENVLTWL